MQRVVFHRYGDPEVLELEETTPPAIKAREILVEQKASSINPVDCKVKKGTIRFVTGWKFPKIPGADFAGTVLKSNDPNYREGDEVFGYLNPLKGGAFSEQIVVKAQNCAPKPKNLTLQEAGVIPCVGLTALEALVYHGQVKKGSSVFINGCTGGVGSFAVLIAKALGAEVTGTCSTKNVDFAGELGVDQIIDYTQTSLELIPLKFDLVFDTTGFLALNDLKQKGHKTSKYASTGISPGLLFQSLFSSTFTMIAARPNAKKLDDLRALIEAYELKPVITKQFPLVEAATAFRDFETKGGKGKYLVNIQG